MAIQRMPEAGYKLIVHHTLRAQRELHRPVFPWEVQGRLPIPRAEGSLRRDMYYLYMTGRLVRVGGNDARQGYRVPTAMERLSWALNGGLWPLGCERVVC